MAFIIAILGLIPLFLGGVLMLALVMPTFGGRNDGVTSFIVGLVLVCIGLSAIFYAGSWL